MMRAGFISLSHSYEKFNQFFFPVYPYLQDVSLLMQSNFVSNPYFSFCSCLPDFLNLECFSAIKSSYVVFLLKVQFLHYFLKRIYFYCLIFQNNLDHLASPSRALVLRFFPMEYQNWSSQVAYPLKNRASSQNLILNTCKSHLNLIIEPLFLFLFFFISLSQFCNYCQRVKQDEHKTFLSGTELNIICHSFYSHHRIFTDLH